MFEQLLQTYRKRDPAACPVCGNRSLGQRPVLWQELIDAWQLSAQEARYIDQQQGQYCLRCQCNLRSRTLAAALLDVVGYAGTLEAYCRPPWLSGRRRVLELNEAGGLSPWLGKLPGHVLGRYPEVDMQALPYADSSWGLVLHSDVLEHVPSPSVALRECWRVLAPGGALIYTIPVVYGRLSRTRQELPPSYHGTPGLNQSGWLVHTEYGADFWVQAMAANFRKLTVITMGGPESLAVICHK